MSVEVPGTLVTYDQCGGSELTISMVPTGDYSVAPVITCLKCGKHSRGSQKAAGVQLVFTVEICRSCWQIGHATVGTPSKVPASCHEWARKLQL